MDEVLCCTQVNCTCENFQPSKTNLRTCDHCTHSWVKHAVSKLCPGVSQVASGQVEMVESSLVLHISSLMLFGTQALPVHMKILLDRLFSVLTHSHVLNILHTLGWTLRDYVRGYILQDSMGKVLDRWVTMTPEDEAVTLQQFLRFGETKSIVKLMTGQEQQERLTIVPKTPQNDSKICSFIESSRSCSQVHAGERFGCQTPPSLHHFENLPGGSLTFLQPFQYGNPSTAPPLGPSCTRGQGASGMACRLRKPGQNQQKQLLESQKSEAMPASPSPNRSDNVSIAESDCCTPATLPKRSNETRSSTFTKKGATSTQGSSSSSGVRDRGLSLSLRKGRVSCGACGKTFYDKGTLKIHYNAVHLKIKHRCTVEGCNMVFSSLRSRNRHSANPNPRLHAPALRGASSPPLQTPSHIVGTTVPPGQRIKPSLGTTPLGIPSHVPIVFPAASAMQQPLPFLETAPSPGRPSKPTSATLVVTEYNGETTISQHVKQYHTPICESGSASRLDGQAFQQLETDHRRIKGVFDIESVQGGQGISKKKSRKSRMPVKIKRESLSERNEEENEEDKEGESVFLVEGLTISPLSSVTLMQPSKCCLYNGGAKFGQKIEKKSQTEVGFLSSNGKPRNSSSKEEGWFSGTEMKQAQEGKVWLERQSSAMEGRVQLSVRVKEEECDPTFGFYRSRYWRTNTNKSNEKTKNGDELDDEEYESSWCSKLKKK